MKVICANCGEEFERPPCEIRNQLNQFCSRACYDNFRAREYSHVVCPSCGMTFKTPKSEPHTYCSRGCNLRAGQGRKKVPTRNCKTPGVVVARPDWRGANPDKAAFFESHEACYLKEARAMLEGKNTAGKNKCVKLEGDGT